MSIKQKNVSEMSVEQRLNATPIQNKFLLLYSIMFEWKYRFEHTSYESDYEKEAAKKELNKKKFVCSIYKLYECMGFRDAEECSAALLTSTRFTINKNGYIDIK